MRMRALIVSAAVLTIPCSAAAEPPKASQPRPAAVRPTPVIFASADQLPGARAVPVAAASTSAKRPRAGRVTTCRCGGDPQPRVQEQP
jgi:hypothetical protein